MKFLVINTIKKPVPSLPQTTLKKMWDDTMKDVEQWRKAGTILAMYYIPGYDKVVTIEEHNSAETLLQHLSGHQMRDFFSWEVYPLVDNFDETRKVLVKIIKMEV